MLDDVLRLSVLVEDEDDVVGGRVVLDDVVGGRVVLVDVVLLLLEDVVDVVLQTMSNQSLYESWSWLYGDQAEMSPSSSRVRMRQ